jgi:hypothetical protein
MWMVEHLYLSGWADAEWQIDGEPWRFATKAEAEAEIRDFVRGAREAGLRDYRVRDYRVVEVEQ